MNIRAVSLVVMMGVSLVGGVLWWRGQAESTPVAVEDITPQAGKSAQAESPAAEDASHEPKKSHTGKVLSAEPTLPMVTVGGKQIITKKMLYEQELYGATPESLQGDATAELLKRRLNIGGYAHNPTLGPADAALQLVEVNDLSCIQCLEVSKRLDAVMDAHSPHVRLTNIHGPTNTFQGVNLPAFYGKVAQRGGVFWEYRKALQTLQSPTPDAYFETLIQVGMDRLEARRLVQTESRRFYRELDADAQLVAQMHLGAPPHVFVNGIHVGANAIPLEKLEDVVTYETSRPQVEPAP